MRFWRGCSLFFLLTWSFYLASPQAPAMKALRVVVGGSPSGKALEMNIVPSTLFVSRKGAIYGCCIGDNGSGFEVNQTAMVSPFSIEDLFSEGGGVVTDTQRNVYVIDRYGGITRIDLDSGSSQVIAKASAILKNCGVPQSVDDAGNIYCSGGNYGAEKSGIIRRLNPQDGAVVKVAGTGAPHQPGSANGDGGLAINATLGYVSNVRATPSGDIFFVDSGNSYNDPDHIRRVDAKTGVITTVLSSQTITPGARVWTFAADPHFLYATSSNDVVTRVDLATRATQRIAGVGSAGFSGDGGSAANAALNIHSNSFLSLDHNNGLLIADTGNKRIRRIDLAKGAISTIAGNGTSTFAGEGILAINASLGSVPALVFDSSGNLYLADCGNSRIRRVDASTGIITTIAGNGTAGYSGDGGAATGASLNCPLDIALDSSDNIYIADTANHVIRRVDHSSGVITTIAGNGSSTPSNAEGAATTVGIGRPTGIAVTTSGDLWITDYETSTLRRVNLSTDQIEWVQRNGPGNYVDRLLAIGDDVIAYEGPTSVTIGLYERLAFGLSNVVNTVLKNADGEQSNKMTLALQAGTCTGADLSVPSRACLLGSFASDTRGNIYASEPYKGVRRIGGVAAVVSTVAGGGPWWNQLGLMYPQGIAIAPTGDLYIAAYKEHIGIVVVSVPASALSAP